MANQNLFYNSFGLFSSSGWFYKITCFTSFLTMAWNAYDGKTGEFNFYVAGLIFFIVGGINFFFFARSSKYFLSERSLKLEANAKSMFIGWKIPLGLGDNTLNIGVTTEFAGCLGVFCILAWLQLRGQYLIIGVNQTMLISNLLFSENLVNLLYACIIPTRTIGKLRVFCNLYLQNPYTSVILVVHLLVGLFVFLGNLSVLYPHRGSATVGFEIIGWAWDVIRQKPTVIRWPVLIIIFADLLTNSMSRLIGDVILWREILNRNDGFDISFLLPLYIVSNFTPAVLVGIQYNFIPLHLHSYFIAFALAGMTFYIAKFLANRVFRGMQFLGVFFAATFTGVILTQNPWTVDDRFNIIITLLLTAGTSMFEIFGHDLIDQSAKMLILLDTEPPLIDKTGTNNF